MCSVYMVGYWQGCRLVIIAFGLILMFMSAADALRRQCSPTALSYFFLKVPPQTLPNANAAGLWFMCSSHAIVFFFAMHKVCLTLQLLRSVPSTWFKPPCALESCFFPALNVVQHAIFAVAGTYIYILKYCIVYVSKLSTCSTRTTASLSLSGLASFCDGSHAAHERRFEVAFDPEWRSRRCSKVAFRSSPRLS